MLVLTRKLNESIVIEGGITVTVVEVRGNRVKLGVVAPENRFIHRAEVHREISRELREALR